MNLKYQVNFTVDVLTDDETIPDGIEQYVETAIHSVLQDAEVAFEEDAPDGVRLLCDSEVRVKFLEEIK